GADYRTGAFGWGVPLGGAAILGPTPVEREPDARQAPLARGASTAEMDPEAAHLQSVNEVTGWSIDATDGSIGHLDELLIGSRDWSIHELVIDTRNWLPGRKVLIAPGLINTIDWIEHHVVVNLSRDAIKQSPEYDPEAPVSEGFESTLAEHYHDY